MRTAVFPGSFDPITRAHIDIVERAKELFDKIYIAVGTNTTKKGFFSHDERLAIIKETFALQTDSIEAVLFEGLTVDFCKKVKARYILRGMRNAADFEFEKAIALNNAVLASDIETVFLVSSSGLSHISSTIVREIISNNGDVSQLVPDAVVNMVRRK
ncbi:pantetheine-phosphate adenylyltransferase [Parapedobacter indicus]|uniref:Phosphopantetheine adenylyltransferase n=1 Tax=Parapedobacter indicus TaxID=1477437 RepID=A0A1I3R6M8_9SPHI|nr:pantetheine-phosphate adenylyltransferase [Parapedobacter indicus]PPL00374.1 phosphopantetheine adenylyltransferase [Parapedobacter indicus]SFJ41775.1 Phosphopantetheine adenylyltransferase [Parapedobacter indicus]